MRTAFVLVAAAALALTSAAVAKDKDPAADEAKQKADAAKLVADFAAWCGANGAKAEGLRALAEAAALGAADDTLAATRATLDALGPDPFAADVLAKQKKADGPRIAAVYDKLAAVDHDPKDAARFDDYLVAAVRWDASAARVAKVRRLVDDALGGGKPDVGGRLLVGLRRADADGAAAGRYDKIEIDNGSKDAVMIGSDAHALVGYVALPKGWAKGKSYPVLVDVDGAGSNFLGSCRTFATQRGSRPVIVLAPVTFSNTNELTSPAYACYPPALVAEWNAKNGRRHDFDGPGVDALLEVVRKRFGGEEKVFLTGFSGGGQYTYWKLFHDPARVRGAAPACANFAGAGLEGAPGAGEGGGPRVHIFTGEKDQHRDHVFGKPPGIEGQSDLAAENLKRLGYTRVERTMVKGAGHEAFPALVWRFIDDVMGVK